MVQLKILSGSKAGTVWVARRFPVRVGRSTDSDPRLEEPGVWEQHFEVQFKPREGFLLNAQPNALVSVNSVRSDGVLLRNGDLIEAGSLKLQFWLTETRQKRMQVREWLTWIAIGAVCLGQVALVYWLRV